MNPLTTRTAACLAVVAMTLLGSAPATTALPTVDVDEDVHAGLHDGGLHAEASVHVALTDGSSTVADEAPGTGPVFVPVVCAGTCTVGSSTLTGYSPPLTVVQDGSSVEWVSSDITHIQRETTVTPTACFSVPVSGSGAPSAAVRFDIVAGTVTATVGAVTTTCNGAVPVAGEAFLVPYHCTLHPTMRAFVLVVPVL